jgi:hypothetical protein
VTTSLEQYLFTSELYDFNTPVVVILSKPWEMIGETEKALLSKILSSVRVSLDSICITTDSNVDLKKLFLAGTKKVLIFGSNTPQEITPYQVSTVVGMNIIKADDLDALDDSRKKSLWAALKYMFPQ